jgi:hypothetical protein
MPFIQALGFGAGCVEHQQGFAGVQCALLSGNEQGGANPLAAHTAMDKHLGDIPAVGLIFGLL